MRRRSRRHPCFPGIEGGLRSRIGRTTESLPLPPVPTSCPGRARSVANTSSPAPRKASNPPSLGKSHRARVESIATQPKPSSGNGSFAALTPAGSVITIAPSDWTSVSIALSASPPTIRTPPCSEKTALPGNAAFGPRRRLGSSRRKPDGDEHHPGERPRYASEVIRGHEAQNPRRVRSMRDARPRAEGPLPAPDSFVACFRPTCGAPGRSGWRS